MKLAKLFKSEVIKPMCQEHEKLTIIAIGSGSRELQDLTDKVTSDRHPYWAWKGDKWTFGWQGTP